MELDLDDSPASGSWQSRAADVWDRIRTTVQEKAHFDHVSPDSFRYASVNVYQDMEEHLDTVYDTKKELFDGRRPWTSKIVQIIKVCVCVVSLRSHLR